MNETSKIAASSMVYWHGKTWIIDRVQADNTLVLLDCYSRSRFNHTFPSISSVSFVATFEEWFYDTVETSIVQKRIEEIRASNQFEAPTFN